MFHKYIICILNTSHTYRPLHWTLTWNCYMCNTKRMHSNYQAAGVHTIDIVQLHSPRLPHVLSTEEPSTAKIVHFQCQVNISRDFAVAQTTMHKPDLCWGTDALHSSYLTYTLQIRNEDNLLQLLGRGSSPKLFRIWTFWNYWPSHRFSPGSKLSSSRVQCTLISPGEYTRMQFVHNVQKPA